MKCIYLKLGVKSRAEAQYKIDKYAGLIANEEKADRAAELVIANGEKIKRADELLIANEEKANRAAELVIANGEKAERAAELVIANIGIEQSELQLLSSLNALAKARDNETGNHIIRTQHYVKVLALGLRSEGYYVHLLCDASIDLLFKAAPLHDIGKVGIPDSILLKISPLTNEEWAIMKTHTLIGESVLKTVDVGHHAESDVITKAIKIAGGHHERWDGFGYPRGLAGGNIPLEARIMSIADTYDALVTARVYKEAWSHKRAVEEIISGRGIRFDPAMVDVFIIKQDVFGEIAKKYQDS